MRNYLIARNQNIAQELVRLAELLKADAPVPELSEYVRWMRVYHEYVSKLIDRNLQYLALAEDAILDDVTSETGRAIQLVRVLGSILLSPIVRARNSDRLTLRVISWLHNSHALTRGLPAAFVDGQCSIRAMRHPFPPLYSFPASEQLGLVFQALHFHEFGHLLYRYREPELDSLVREIQAEVDEMLVPASFRNDRHSERQADERRAIVDTWYKWAQELFCDCVGLCIGGPAYLYAFSGHCAWLAHEDFYRRPDSLRLSEHPVTWLRVEMLVTRARRLGLTDAADKVDAEWRKVAMAMNRVPDYHGFFDPRLAPGIERILDDMLTEASPRVFKAEEVASDVRIDADTNPTILTNLAWRKFYELGPEDYQGWERQAIATWLPT